MTNERVVQLISVAKEKNLTNLNLSGNQLTQVPQEIGELKNLTMLDLSENTLTILPQEIGELKNLKTLDLSGNQLIQLPSEIGRLKNLTILNLYDNQLTQLPPEIKELKNLTALTLFNNKLTQIPPEIGKLKNLETLYIYCNQLTQLPPEIGELKNLSILALNKNKLTQLPSEIGNLKNLETLSLYRNQLIELPPEIGKLENLKTLYIDNNKLTILPPEISELKNLITLNLSANPLTSPPPEIVSRGLEAIFTYLNQSKTTENNEAKLVLVGNGEVGKTCLAYRLIYDNFLEDSKITEGINISKWKIPAPDSGNSEIKLNIWDFGGQEIYHATHQFFLTKRSLYLLLWNARKTKDYDNIYYWLHTIEAFGEDSPVILVMSKMNESNDDLNLKDLKNKFPQIVDYLKIDSKDGKGISILKEKISETAWDLPLMKAKWVDSWFKVRQKLEDLNENWINYYRFYDICKSEGLDEKNITVLDDYLNDLGVTLHFKDRLTLKNIVILKPEWATGAFYKILSTKSVLDNEGALPQSELSQIWNTKTYPPSVHPQLMELMNKFELSYELPDKSNYLIPELLPKNEPDNFEWNKEDDLCFYYCYDYFLPSGIITRFIVRMHENLVIKENGMPLCWREGAVLKFQNSSALVKMKPDERQIEIRIKGNNKRWVLGAICSHLDEINASIKKIKVSKQIPCNCSENCPQRYLYEDLLKAEVANLGNLICYKSFKSVPVSLLLDGYSRKEERLREYDYELYGNRPIFVITQKAEAQSKSLSTIKAEQRTNISVDVNIDLKIDLPEIQKEFNKLKKEIKTLNPELGSELDEIQDSLDEVSANSDTDKLNKPLNKVRRILEELNDPDSDYNKVIKGTEKGIEYAQKLGRTYNKFAPWIGIPKVPDPLL
ncbi:hypothetical protein MSBRW_1387 [Methanosarcina barkeri str. Wiesmoor]|uniref:non-specific serine/threonine protein kinase n=2 Tax=Methanosarcina barkeri TaxID=2208 RepID=A0A0E3QKF0_METBA|nr:COR domain-containing protein [Methanosarcina barkeri]AKB50640.1 hypothetical protein MSBRW_1387 [Methanosarcina barkeri str. Wiesmoor]